MILPTLVLVTSMQFSDPQCGMKIDDLSHTSWRNVPIPASVEQAAAKLPQASVVPVVYASQNEQPSLGGLPPNDFPAVPSGTPNTPVSETTQPTEDNHSSAALPPIPNIQEYSKTAPQNYAEPNPVFASTNRTLPQSGTYALVAANNNVTFSGRTMIENGEVKITRAIVKFDKISRLGAPVTASIIKLQTPKYDASGKLVKNSAGEPVWIDVVRGVVVAKGIILCQLENRYPLAQYNAAKTKLEVAKKDAERDIEIRYARSKLDLAENELKRAHESNERYPGVVTPSEMEQRRLQAIESSLQLEKAIQDRETLQQQVLVQQEEVNVAEAQLDLRQIKAPFNAMVINVVTQEGSTLRESDPVVEVAQLDKLKVEAAVDGNQLTQEQLDKKRVTVTASYPNGQKENFDGFVRYAAPSFNLNKQFEIEIEVTNRLVNGSWLLKEGDYVEVTIPLK